MATEVFEFEFSPSVVLTEAELTLQLAFLATEGLLGESRVRLEGRYEVDETRRCITVDVATEVGQTAARIYAGLLMRELGSDSFKVRRPHVATAGEQATPLAPPRTERGVLVLAHSTS